jgi:uncharacterized phage-associated protein
MHMTRPKAAVALPRALDVARYLVLLAASEGEGGSGEPDVLTRLRLHKLLYYAQGWSLAVRARPLFADDIRAGRRGPEVLAVEQAFRRHGSRGIPRSCGTPDGLSGDDRVFVQRVWNTYKRYSAVALAELALAEAPWLAARAGVSPEAADAQPIQHAALRAGFRQLARS